jgi:hypothetical protein
VTLAETQALFHAAVTGEVPPSRERLEACFAGTADLPAAARVGIYAGMYVARLLDALGATFPALRRLLGEERFAALGADYVRRHPSEHHDVGQVGRRLPDFLRSHPDPARPDLADLALLEWERQEAFFAPTPHGTLPPGALARDPEAFPRTRLAFSPALRVLALEHDPTALWRALEAGEAPPAPERRAAAVAVWRVGFEVVHARVGEPEAEALLRALAGAPLAEVCEAFAPAEDPAREAFEALSSWLAEGWIAGAGEPPVPRMAAASDDGGAIARRGGASAAGGAGSAALRQEGAR